MDVVLPEGSGGLVALHLDLKGITTDGVNQVIGLMGWQLMTSLLAVVM